jgi:hypothetical protein
MSWSDPDMETTQKIKRPKPGPRHKKDPNIGMKFLVVLAGVVFILGIFAYVDWASLGGDKADGPSGTATVPGPTVTETQWSTSTAPGNTTTRTVTADSQPGPTSTVTIAPSPAPTATVTAKETVTATATVPGPEKTVHEPGPATTITKCYDASKTPAVEMTCP